MRVRSKGRALALQALYCMALHSYRTDEEDLVAQDDEDLARDDDRAQDDEDIAQDDDRAHSYRTDDDDDDRAHSYQRDDEDDRVQEGDELVQEANWLLDTEKEGQPEHQFALLIINGVLNNLEQINEVIRTHIHHWDFSRLLEVDKAILRLSAYGLLYLTDVPVAVTINEAIELAKQYSDAHSPQFINGILDACAKSTD